MKTVEDLTPEDSEVTRVTAVVNYDSLVDGNVDPESYRGAVVKVTDGTQLSQQDRDLAGIGW